MTVPHLQELLNTEEARLLYDLIYESVDYGVTLSVLSEHEPPEKLPFLEHIERVPTGILGAVKKAAEIARRQEATDLANLVALAERTNALYPVHRDIIMDLRGRYQKVKEMPVAVEELGLVQRLLGKKPRERNLVEEFEGTIPDLYFAELANKLERQALQDYVSLAMSALSLLRYNKLQEGFRRKALRAAQDSGMPGAARFMGRAADRLIGYVNARPDQATIIVKQLQSVGEAFVEGLYHRKDEKEESI